MHARVGSRLNLDGALPDGGAGIRTAAVALLDGKRTTVAAVLLGGRVARTHGTGPHRRATGNPSERRCWRPNGCSGNRSDGQCLLCAGMLLLTDPPLKRPPALQIYDVFVKL